MRSSRVVCFLAFLALSRFAVGQSVIDFESTPADRNLDRTYATLGVVFTNGFVNVFNGTRTAPPAHSGTHMAHIFPGEFSSSPLTFTFLPGSLPTHVWFYGGSYGGPPARGTAKAFDASGRLLVQDGPKATAGNAVSTLFDLRVGSPMIARVEFFVETAYPRDPTHFFPSDIALDDLSFEGGAPPVPVQPPTITLTSPGPGSQVDTAKILVKGTVSGDQLVPSIHLVLKPDTRHPKDFSPGEDVSVPLTGTGTTRTFSQEVFARKGVQTISVTAQNVLGLQASTNVQVLNLPLLARDTGALGPLRFAWGSSHCTAAVYATGARTANGTAGFVIGPNMLPKWLDWTSARWNAGHVDDFCPTGPEHPTAFGVTAQDYVGGRIYFDSGRGAFYVPLTFATAIDALGGEAATGVPLGDPIASPAAQTWVFQQFARSGSSALVSTLEIKGDPAELWIQRAGGDLAALNGAGLPLGPSTATIAENFPCQGPNGPCAVEAPKPPGHVRTPGALCGFSPKTNPEWVNVEPQGEYNPKAVYGWVHESHAADDDDAVTHEFNQEHKGGRIWADWNVILAPIGKYRSLLAGNSELEIEFEEHVAHYFFIQFNSIPQVGELYYAAGRFIIDCGHDDWSSEIHPPVVTASIRTEYRTTASGAKTPLTKALVWVNGYYLGGKQVEFLLYPPPRPAPNAFLTLDRTRNEDAGTGVTMIGTGESGLMDPRSFSYARVRFNAPRRNAQWGAANTGMLKFQSGREYKGSWSLSWRIESNYQVVPLGVTWWP